MNALYSLHHSQPFSDLEFLESKELMKNYTLKELVGKGGFGTVHLAESKKDGKQAVVKEKFDLTSFRPILLVKNFTVYFCQTRTSALKLRV